MARHMAEQGKGRNSLKPSKAPTRTGLHGEVSSTGRHAPVRSAFLTLFVIIVMAMVLVPFACMGFASSAATSEKKDLAEWPSLTVDGGLNTSYLSQAGDYFNDHFAFRSALVDLDSTIKEKLFGTTSTESVVVGTDGWLYYGGTLDDYQRTNQMSDREIKNAAYNLSLIQEYVVGKGKSFAFTIAPDKASLYPDHMPYYEVAGTGPSNVDRLVPYLTSYGITYVDLFSALSSSDDVLYFKTDTHWTNAGALVGYNALLDAVGKRHETYRNAPVTTDDSHVGDLASMLNPSSATTEEQPLYAASTQFEYTNGAASVEDSLIKTRSKVSGKTGALLMYRDSFGNALLPYLATEYASAEFTKMIPYDMADIDTTSADCVIIERAERHLSFFATTPPYMQAPMRDGIQTIQKMSTDTTLHASVNGPYLQIEGALDPRYVSDDTKVYVRLMQEDGSATTYEAYHVTTGKTTNADAEGGSEGSSSGVDGSSDYGYLAYVTGNVAENGSSYTVEVLVGDGQKATRVLASTMTIGE